MEYERLKFVENFEKISNDLFLKRKMGFYDITYGDVVKKGDLCLKDGEVDRSNKESLYAADGAIRVIDQYKQFERDTKRKVVSPNVSKPDRDSILYALSAIYVYLAPWKNRKEIFIMIHDKFDRLADEISTTTGLSIEAVLAEAKRSKTPQAY